MEVGMASPIAALWAWRRALRMEPKWYMGVTTQSLAGQVGGLDLKCNGSQ